MQHRIDALLNFIAAELTENENDACVMVSDYNICQIANRENVDPEQIGAMIYKTYKDLGYEHARGEFSVLFND